MAQDDDTQRAAVKAAARAVVSGITNLPPLHLREHPLIAEKAKLPTAAIKRAVSNAITNGVKHRNATTWWANPVTGKTFCIEVIVAALTEQFPDSGIFVYEPEPLDDEKEKRSPLRTRESRSLEFLASLLEALEVTERKEHSFAVRKKQVCKALLALALPSRHLFIIFDEVQNMDNERYLIFKHITNWLEIKHDVHLNIISFGQSELKAKRKMIRTEFRSDIEERFVGDLYEFIGIRSAEDLRIPLAACDSGSEYPLGSKKTYTASILPKAVADGFEIASATELLFDAFISASKLRRGETGIAMEYVANALSELMLILVKRDGSGLKVTPEDCKEAVAATRWARRSPVRSEPKGGDK